MHRLATIRTGTRGGCDRMRTGEPKCRPLPADTEPRVQVTRHDGGPGHPGRGRHRAPRHFRGCRVNRALTPVHTLAFARGRATTTTGNPMPAATMSPRFFVAMFSTPSPIFRSSVLPPV